MSFESGTAICIKISNSSNKTVAEVLDRFADVDGGFTRTRIPIKYCIDTYPISRSQAEWLSKLLEAFEVIELN